MSSSTAMPGSCFCGAIRFEATPPTLFCAHCHCSMCRRVHGAAFVTWFSVPQDRFRILEGGEHLRRHESSPHGVRSFCGVCGSSLFYETSEHPDRVDVVLASMLGPIDRGPQLHVYFSNRVPWIDGSDALPRLGGASGFEPIDDA